MKIASGVYSVPAVSACADFSCNSYYSFFYLGFATPTLVPFVFEGAVAASHVASVAADAPLLAFVPARDTALRNCAADVYLK
jgi:hypothetical protein